MSNVTIKDPVHGYIELDDLERQLVDSPWCQRLKHIKQNDVSLTVYPAMHSTRFEHSLGAMHVAGQCIKSALQELTEREKEVLDKQLTAELEDQHITSKSDGEDISLISIARIYGLLHDIGHPPYSHLMEYSIPYSKIIGETVEEGKIHKWHELNGMHILRDQIIPMHSSNLNTKTLLETVELLMKGDVTWDLPLLKAIKQLVDAVIDADRMDYVLRDGRTSGANFGTYDIARLVKSFRVAIETKEDDSIRKIHIRPTIKALSAVESLLQERHKLYRWVHFHHRVIMEKALIRFIISQLVKREDGLILKPEVFQPKYYFNEKLNEYPFLFLSDSYIYNLFTRLFKELESQEGDLELADKHLRSALRALLLRENWVISLWKRKDLYSETTESFNSLIKEAFRNISSPPEFSRIEDNHGSIANWIGDYSIQKKGQGRGFLDHLEHQLQKDGEDWYLLEVTEGFNTLGEDRILTRHPRAGKEDGQVWQAVALSDISTIANAISTAWKHDIHFYAFRIAGSKPWKINEDLSPQRLEGREKVARLIVDEYEDSELLRSEMSGILNS